MVEPGFLTSNPRLFLEGSRSPKMMMTASTYSTPTTRGGGQRYHTVSQVVKQAARRLRPGVRPRAVRGRAAVHAGNAAGSLLGSLLRPQAQELLMDVSQSDLLCTVPDGTYLGHSRGNDRASQGPFSH